MAAFRRNPGSVTSPSTASGIAYHYVNDEASFAELLGALKSAPEYAIDTEFHRERTYYPRLALVQLAVGGGIYIVDPLALDISALAPILTGDGLALLHAGDQDLEVLERACGATPSRIFDTQIAAGFLGYRTPSLASLVEGVLGIQLAKGDQLTDWTRRPLDENQLSYAAGDVAYLHALHDTLAARLTGLGRETWAESECAGLLARAHDPVDPETSWWRLKQARQLRGKARGVIQEVAAWRELRAQDLDLPVRFVLSDLAVVAIANRPPTTISELEQVRGIDNRHLSGGAGASLLEAIAKGSHLPPDRVLAPPTSNGEATAKPAVAIAAAWIGARAEALGIDPAILATRADLVAFLHQPPHGRLVTSWRHGLVGEPIQALLNGQAALALVEGKTILEERSGRPFPLDGASEG